MKNSRSKRQHIMELTERLMNNDYKPLGKGRHSIEYRKRRDARRLETLRKAVEASNQNSKKA
jgi:hypothetical protein